MLTLPFGTRWKKVLGEKNIQKLKGIFIALLANFMKVLCEFFKWKNILNFLIFNSLFSKFMYSDASNWIIKRNGIIRKWRNVIFCSRANNAVSSGLYRFFPSHKRSKEMSDGKVNKKLFFSAGCPKYEKKLWFYTKKIKTVPQFK